MLKSEFAEILPTFKPATEAEQHLTELLAEHIATRAAIVHELNDCPPESTINRRKRSKHGDALDGQRIKDALQSVRDVVIDHAEKWFEDTDTAPRIDAPEQSERLAAVFFILSGVFDECLMDETAPDAMERLLDRSGALKRIEDSIV